MSRGFGKAERLVLAEIVGEPLSWRASDGSRHLEDEGAGLPPGRGVPLLWLAERYAETFGVAYTHSVVESVRRAVRSLERQGLVTIDHRQAPRGELPYDPGRGRVHLRGRYERRARWKRMLVVGRPTSEGLALHHPYYPKYAGPTNSRIGSGHCVECGAAMLAGREKFLEAATSDDPDAGEWINRTAATAALESPHLEPNDLCYGCWCDRHPKDRCLSCAKWLDGPVHGVPVDGWCRECWNIGLDVEARPPAPAPG